MLTAIYQSEISRAGFGDLTSWVSKLDDEKSLIDEINSLDEVAFVGSQNIIYANYELNGQESDSEGQLVVYDAGTGYRFFNDALTGYKASPQKINDGQVYVSASLVSIFGAKKGDILEAVVARSGVKKELEIAGFFEDPFAGSSMIGLKSFLIGESDYNDIAAQISKTSIDSLAREGLMIHISAKDDANLTSSELNGLLNSKTPLASYTEFTHSAQTMKGFMLLLENIFSGVLLAFAAILLAVSFIVLGHIIASTIEHETTNISILKTVGFTNAKLQGIQVIQYGISIVSGILAGILASLFVSPLINRMTLTSIGVLVPSKLPLGLVLPVFLLIVCIMGVFILIKTAKTKNISPVAAIRNEKSFASKASGMNIKIRKKGLFFRSALRQIMANKKNYIGICIVALLLVFFASSIGRINAWLGPNGEGLMDAFNPADLHLGVQIFSDRVSVEDVENVIGEYSTITDRYDLAMPNVALNGVDYTANVITEPERFHILEGKTCSGANEVVLTEFLAEDLSVTPGDTVTLSVGQNRGEYVVSGLYQCANDMGANLGLSKEGYLKLGRDDYRIWCMHYFIEDPGFKNDIMHTLEERYKADVHVHENAWPGLYGILSAMKLLMIFLYVVAAVFILIVVSLTSGKLLDAEQKDMAIYKSFGFSTGGLRRVFINRFFIVTVLGSALGIALSAAATDALVDFIMRFAGISGFDSHLNLAGLMLPFAAVTGLFVLFAWAFSKRIKTMDITQLIDE